MVKISDPIMNLIKELSKLPGVGEKTATRLAFYILRSSNEYATSLSEAVLDIKRKITYCSTCWNLSENNPCEICSDDGRQNDILCVVEDPVDLMAIEKSGAYKGRYHILHGVISPLDGIGPEKLKINEFMNRIANGKIKEVIIATNLDVEGEATALYISKLIKPTGLKVTRIAMGVPKGGDLEYIDKTTISKSIENRIEI